MTFIAEWKIGQNTGRLLHERDSLFVYEEQNANPIRFRSRLYDANYARQLIHMFYRTIAINLQNNIHQERPSSCFFPMLCKRAASNFDVALFGYCNGQDETVKGLRWGCVNSFNGDEQTFEVDDLVAQAFIRYAPITNQPDIRNGRPGSCHYAMTFCAQQFRVVLDQDIDHRIRRVALQYISSLDPSVILDKEHWAVTLVSAKNAATGFGFKTGHAMIACEGVRNGRPLIKYFHFRQTDRTVAQWDHFETNHHKPDLLKGPTWLRTKKLVDKMISYTHKINGKMRLQLAAPLTRPSTTFRTFTQLAKWVELADAQVEGTSVENCLTAAIVALQEAGIYLYNPTWTTPNRYIRKLRDYTFPIDFFGNDPVEKEGFIIMTGRNKTKQAEFTAICSLHATRGVSHNCCIA